MNADTTVPSEIPSVVAVHQRKNTLMIGAFLAFMSLIALIVCRKPNPTRTTNVVPQIDNLPAGPSLPEPAPYPKPVLKFAPASIRRIDSDGNGNRLLEVRRNSPVVIFNQNSSTASGSGIRAESPGVPGMPSDNPGGNGSGGTENSGVPLPSGFTPSSTTNTHAELMGDRDYILAQGKLMDAVLETAVDSDHPGMLRALISHDVYGDSGRAVLLPRGTRLIGQYDSAVARGQNRVFVIWERAIRPDGIDVRLGSAGTDSLGRTGIEGDVNNHFFMMFGAAAVLSVIGASASTIGVSPQDQNNSLSQYRQSVTGGFNSAAGTVLGQFVQIKPTITVRQGVAIKVFLGRDVSFDPALLGSTGIEVIP